MASRALILTARPAGAMPETRPTRVEKTRASRTKKRILIALLIYWLTIADFSGDTDVAAAIAPILG